jgi:two-component system chemotaxis response regulator CheB
MAGQDIIVVGASAGGVEALTRLVGAFPPGLPAAVFVVCHFPGEATSTLPQILSRSGPVLASHARGGEPIQHGQIYVAPPDYHMLLRPGFIELDHGARENRHRPAIDPLFRTAARAYGDRVAGVILSGLLADGVAGLLAVRSAGGVAVVQDPAEAELAGMPEAALQIAGADYVLPAAEIGGLLARLPRQPVPGSGGPDMADPLEQMPVKVVEDMTAQAAGARRGELSVYSCPECGGTLWQVDEPNLLRFRCHVGHSYYGESLLLEKSHALEAALWTAVRTFKEKAVLARQMAAEIHAAQQPGGGPALRGRGPRGGPIRAANRGDADAGRAGGPAGDGPGAGAAAGGVTGAPSRCWVLRAPGERPA